MAGAALLALHEVIQVAKGYKKMTPYERQKQHEMVVIETEFSRPSRRGSIALAIIALVSALALAVLLAYLAGIAVPSHDD